MDFIFSFVLSLQFLFWVFLLCALMYLIAKRIEDKKKETFEDRDF